MAKYADKETQRRLIEASNFICEHIARRLPAGWEIIFNHIDGETSVDLYDKSGGRVDVQSCDGGMSTIDDLCVTAIELDER